MRSAESLNGIAVKFRKLAEEANAELAAHLLDLAEEYERMSRNFVHDWTPAPNPWERDAA